MICPHCGRSSFDREPELATSLRQAAYPRIAEQYARAPQTINLVELRERIERELAVEEDDNRAVDLTLVLRAIGRAEKKGESR